MLDLENAQTLARIAIRECIKPGAENDELPRAALDGAGQLIFRIAAVRRHEARIEREAERSDSCGEEVNRAASCGPMIAAARGSSKAFGQSKIGGRRRVARFASTRALSRWGVPANGALMRLPLVLRGAKIQPS